MLETDKRILTIFTPTFNRAPFLRRIYESLVNQTNPNFEWMVIDDGSTDYTKQLIDSFIKENKIVIRYIYKENGGLHTGYNTAYANIETDLCVCVDSDDWMPDNAVELILKKWGNEGSDKYCGIVGLDFDAETNEPIAGYFPAGLKECYYLDLYIKNIHKGDSKYVMRTHLMKKVAPQISFPGEKFFNPTYMFLQVGDEYPLLVLNENLCYIDRCGQNRMSTNIYFQYCQSPRSFAKLRELEMDLKRNNLKNKFRSGVHYISSCLLSHQYSKLICRSHRLITFMALLPGMTWFLFVRLKSDYK